MENLTKIKVLTKIGSSNQIKLGALADTLTELKDAQNKFGGELVVLREKKADDCWENEAQFLEPNLIDYYIKNGDENHIVVTPDNVKEKVWELVKKHFIPNLKNGLLNDDYPNDLEDEIIKLKDFCRSIIDPVDCKNLVVVDMNTLEVQYFIDEESVIFSRKSNDYCIGLQLNEMMQISNGQ